MKNAKSLYSTNNNRLAFFQEFLKHPLQIGSIIPSSRFLEQDVLEAAGVTSGGNIVELGPGLGGITHAILNAMPNDARLLSIEINPRFYELLGNIQDDRFISHLGDASDLRQILSLYAFDTPTVVISGIPFSTINRNTGSEILATISSVLAPHGRFVAYQLSNRVVSLNQPYMGSEKTIIELFNIPPMRVYQWEKQGDKADHVGKKGAYQ